jgi:LL-diaminopimelate aminotransferase
MKIRPADRVSAIKPYFFSELGKSIVALKQSGMDVIRLDIGSPDLPPEDFIIEALVKAARRPDTHGYGQSGGASSLKSACAKYYHDRFSVDLDPEKEVLGLIGSKEGIFNLSQVLVNPSDLVLIPDPCYPVYGVGANVAQAETFQMPLLAKNEFLPDLGAIPIETADRANIMWLNYPNNPTGAVAPYSFFEKVVDFAKTHRIIIAHDAPYVDVCFDGYKAPSILEVPEAKSVAVEFNSLSKIYNMAGWRVGFVVGNPDIINLLRVYKSQLDSSHFEPIMYAAETALLGDQQWIQARNRIYQERRDIISNTLKEIGFTFKIPRASLYVWASIPGSSQDCIGFCDSLLRETGVSVTPGVVYGPSGAGYIRISLVTPGDRLKEAMQRMHDWMKGHR